MKIKNAREFGKLVKETRQAQNLRQVDLAAASGCGERFIIDLEKGKPTCELEKAILVAQMLGISLEAKSPERRDQS